MIIRSVLALTLLVVSDLSFGHHSTSEYDATVVTEIEGVVAKVSWRNPHVMLHVETLSDDGKVIWKLEGSSVSAQRRRGLTSDMVSVGDRVRAAGAASTRRPAHMIVDNLLLPDGRELLLRGNRPIRWPDATAVALKNGVDPAVAAKAKADGIFRVWTWARRTPGWWFFGPTQNFPLTRSALEKQSEWNEFVDNPQLDCIAPGMPATMGNPYPIEFVKVGQNIELREEEFDVVRTIHMGTTNADDVSPSSLGFSTGHWEDNNTLVVSTSKINWQYFNRVGVSQSEAVTVVERFTVDSDAGSLNYHLTVTDPATLTEPYEFESGWKWVPGEVVSEYGCTTEE